MQLPLIGILFMSAPFSPGSATYSRALDACKSSPCKNSGRGVNTRINKKVQQVSITPMHARKQDKVLKPPIRMT
ncbi:hypothetical protein LSAT2_012757 [Lamellibrachia satsuma]|nr:hypothetical protein LSAT2_012757 [Lamellibrachia satsuma]